MNGNMYPDYTTNPNLVYYRWGDHVGEAFNVIAPPIVDLWVRIGWDAIDGQFQVLKVDSRQSGLSVPVAGYAPSSRYTWGGQDPLILSLRQMRGFRPTVNNGMILTIGEGLLETTAGWRYIAEQTYDLSTYRPATLNYAAFMLFTFNTSGTLVRTSGTEITPLTDLVATPAPDALLSNLPSIPSDTQYVICACRVYHNSDNSLQPALYESTTNSDLVDLRLFNRPRGAAAGDLSGYYPNPVVAKAGGNFEIAGTLKLTGDISPAQITSSQNNYDPTGLSGASVVRLTSDAARDITGLAGGSDGRVLVLVNVGSFNITLKDASGSSSAANQFALYADKVIAPDTGVVLQYDSTSTKWRIIDSMFYGDAASGDLGGTYPNPTVAKIRARAIGNTTPNDGDVLTWVAAASEWDAMAPTGGGGEGGSVLNVNTTEVGNVGAGEDDLITYTVPADTLTSAGQFLHISASGQFAASANNKRLRAKFGATTLFDSGALAITAASDWTLEGWIIRTGAATQEAYVEFQCSDATVPADAQYSTPAETLSGTSVLKLTGEATADNDIVHKTLATDVNGGTVAQAAVLDGPEGFLINGRIEVTVASNNITLALKTLAGADPSAGDPVYVRLGNARRTIAAALSVTKNAGTNWCNAGSAELATKEIDYFVYLGYNTTDGIVFGFSRIPYAERYADFSTTATSETYCAISTITNAAADDPYRVIGRFAATLSAGAGYTWTVPTYTNVNLVQRPIFTTRRLVFTIAVSAQTGTITTVGATSGKYEIFNQYMRVDIAVSITNNGTGATTLQTTSPMSITVMSALTSCVGINQQTGVFTQGFAAGNTIRWATAAFAYPIGSGQTIEGNGLFALTT
jgi:hypothetical protein